MFKQLVTNWQEKRRLRKAVAAQELLRKEGFYVCRITVIAGTTYIIDSEDTMRRVGRAEKK